MTTPTTPTTCARTRCYIGEVHTHAASGAVHYPDSPAPPSTRSPRRSRPAVRHDDDCQCGGCPRHHLDCQCGWCDDDANPYANSR